MHRLVLFNPQVKAVIYFSLISLKTNKNNVICIYIGQMNDGIEISFSNIKSHIMEVKIKNHTKSQLEIFSYIYCTVDLEPFVSFSFHPDYGDTIKKYHRVNYK
jgi:hypothetical protein